LLVRPEQPRLEVTTLYSRIRYNYNNISIPKIIFQKLYVPQNN